MKIKSVQIQQWQSQGSEVEVDRMNVKPSRDPIVMTFERPLAAFGRPNCIFVDKDAQEIHAMSSSHMDARPFKDPNFELQRVLLDKDIQAVPVIQEEGVQVCYLPHHPTASNCVALGPPTPPCIIVAVLLVHHTSDGINILHIEGSQASHVA